MEDGCRELTRALSAYLASLAFAVAFLVTTLCGGSLWTATLRSSAAAAATLLVGSFLLRPLFSTILDAMARDRAEQRAEDATR
jgi:hypothetical protein